MISSSSCVSLTLLRRGIDERVASTSSGVKLWERRGEGSGWRGSWKRERRENWSGRIDGRIYLLLWRWYVSFLVWQIGSTLLDIEATLKGDLACEMKDLGKYKTEMSIAVYNFRSNISYLICIRPKEER